MSSFFAIIKEGELFKKKKKKKGGIRHEQGI